jgi:hypothetical protein
MPSKCDGTEVDPDGVRSIHSPPFDRTTRRVGSNQRSVYAETKRRRDPSY